MRSVLPSLIAILHGLTIDELAEWFVGYDRRGISGLYVTKRMRTNEMAHKKME